MPNLESPQPSLATGGTGMFPPPELRTALPSPGPPRPFLGRLKAALTCALLATSHPATSRGNGSRPCVTSSSARRSRTTWTYPIHRGPRRISWRIAIHETEA